MPVRIVTAGGDPVRVVTSGISDPVRVVTSGLSTPVVVISGSTPPTPPTPPAPDAPTFVSAEVGNVDGQTVVVVFSVAITANGGDYGVGFTILVNGNPDAVTAFNHSAGDTVQLTLTTPVNYGDTVTIAYDDSAGQIHESTGVTALVTFGAQAVTNNVAWYRSGGAPAPIAVYQPKGAANLAASYINLVNPGTYDAAPGVAPTFNAATGWTFDGATQYLISGVANIYGYAVIIRWANATRDAAIRYMFGTRVAGTSRMSLGFSDATHSTFEYGATVVNVSDARTSGIDAVTSEAYYVDGARTAWSPVLFVADATIYLGSRDRYGPGPDVYYAGNVLAAAIYPTSTNADIWIPAVKAAMALL